MALWNQVELTRFDINIALDSESEWWPQYDWAFIESPGSNIGTCTIGKSGLGHRFGHGLVKLTGVVP
jgi:hypothetical protein